MTDKPFNISHTKLATFRRCLQQYHWKYVDKYYPPSSIGQARGIAGHAALAEWHTTYDTDKSMQAAWDNWELAGYTQDEEWQLLEDALNRYYIFSAEKDTFKIITAEKKFVLPLHTLVSSGTSSEHLESVGIPSDIEFIGYIDGIVKDQETFWLLENKFYKRMDNSDLSMDSQVSLYLLAASIMDFKVNGVIYNIIRVADTKIAASEPVIRRKVYRNPAGLQHIKQEIIRQTQVMHKYHQEGGVPYRNPTKDCSWDCPFYQPCLSMTDDGQEPTQILQSITQVRRTDDD